MTGNYQPLCTLCENADICKYTDEYKEEFNKMKNLKHDLFERKLTCKKFKDNRPTTSIDVYNLCSTGQ